MQRLITVPLLVMAIGAQAGNLNLVFYGEGLAGNPVWVAVYSALAQEQFPSMEKPYRGMVIDATSDRLSATVANLPPGKYAVAAFADSNRNGKQDKNFLGMPTEIYGFSNDARGKFGPPAFADAAFEIGENAVSLSIHLH